MVASPIRVTASFSRSWSSGLTTRVGTPISARVSALSCSLRGRMTRSGSSARQPSRSNSLAVPTLGRSSSWGALRA